MPTYKFAVCVRRVMKYLKVSYFFLFYLDGLSSLVCVHSELILKSASYTKSVRLLGWGISPSSGRYLRRKTYMPRVVIEYTIPNSERAKILYAITVISKRFTLILNCNKSEGLNHKAKQEQETAKRPQTCGKSLAE
jgi:hypothetical protein